MELTEIKQYLKVESNEEDMLLMSLQVAAEEYMSNSGVNKDYTKELYKLAIKLLIGHWYDNRVLVGKTDKLAFSLDSIIFQLKYNQEEVVI